MNAPSDLVAYDHWMVWKFGKVKPNGRREKPPRRASDGLVGSKTEPSNWASFEDACAACESRSCDGIGFCLSEDDPFVGIDFDDCRDPETGEVDPAVLKWIRLLDSYTEVSPSGTGLRVFVRGHLPGSGVRTDNTEWDGMVEVYDRGSFLTVTGEATNGSTVADRQEVLMQMLEEFGAASAPTVDSESWISKARKNPLFVMLYDDGDISDHEDNESQADLALINLLIHYIGDNKPRSVFHAFRQSALYRGDAKSGGDDYVLRTIEFALSNDASDPDAHTQSRLDREVARQLFFMEAREEARHRYQEKQAAARIFPYPTAAWSLADELALPPREEVWRVQSLQQMHANVVLIAGYKLGKTTLIMNLIRSLVDGTPFMGEYEVLPIEGNVAVFNYELHPEQWIDWARDMHFQHPEKVKPFHLRGLGANRFWVRSEQDRLVEWMLENHIRYWVLDPTAQAWATLLESEGDNIRAAQFTSAIDEVKARAGIDETNLTHHTSRATQDQGRGPSALEGWYDAGWFLTGKRDDLKFHAIGRDVDVESTSIAYHEDKRRTFLLDHRDEKEKLKEKKESKRTAIEILTEMGPLSQSRLAKELRDRGCGISTSRQAKVFGEWVGSMDNSMALRQQGQARTYYLKGVEGHE